MASAAPLVRDATRGLHVIGHSAGSFLAMVISDILQDPKFGPFYGRTRATAVAMPSKLFETHYTQRKIHLYHVLEDELCLWRPSDEEVTQLNHHGIEVTLISGNAPWMGKRNHSYGHLVFSDLKPGTFSLAKILNVPGVVPLYEKQKAPLRYVVVHLPTLTECLILQKNCYRSSAPAAASPLQLMRYLFLLHNQASLMSRLFSLVEGMALEPPLMSR